MKRPVILIAIVGFILYFVWRSVSEKKHPIGDVKKALKKVSDHYGKEKAMIIERIQRKETRHYKSAQWLGTGSAGMEAFGSKFPYGWPALAEFAGGMGLTEKDFYLASFRDNATGKMKPFIGFLPNRFGENVSTFFMAWLLFKKREGDYLSWYRSNKPENYAARVQYDLELAPIVPVYVNGFW